MTLCIISFTKNGRLLSENIAKKVSEAKEVNKVEETDAPGWYRGVFHNLEIKLYTKCKINTEKSTDQEQTAVSVQTSVGEWAKEQMKEKNAMLFIGACGIAVRAVAPHLTDKLKDAPVLVMDEKGRYVIPVLSGHMGGANELAVCLAEKTGAEPVITTATDLNEKFAVDLFAKENGLFIENKDGIAKVSSKVLDGKTIIMSITPELENYFLTELNFPENCMMKRSENTEQKVRQMPEGVSIAPYSPELLVDVLITSDMNVSDAALILRPKEYVIGMGCKKGKPADEIEDFILGTLDKLGISKAQVFALSSVLQKKDEPGLLAWCKKEGIPFFTYTAQELQETEGNFKSSSFVKDQIGVDNVCERAAVKACHPNGKLIYEKCAKDGMTIAVAKREWKVGTYET